MKQTQNEICERFMINNLKCDNAMRERLRRYRDNKTYRYYFDVMLCIFTRKMIVVIRFIIIFARIYETSSFAF